MSNPNRKRARLLKELATLGVPANANNPPIAREAEIESKQPRFNQPSNIWNSVFRWVVAAIDTEPNAGQGIRPRDVWMRLYVRQEPFLEGILNSVVDIDKNRGWTIEGGRNQVARYTDMLHNADEGTGWRKFIEWQAQSYYTTRMGFVTELGREGEDGPVRAVWSVDPARCLLTGIPDKPFRYYPILGGEQEWPASSFFRVASLVSTDETQLGYGFPAIERCLSLAKIMTGVLAQFKQQVLSEAPEGVMTGKNIGQAQWETALEHYGEALQGYSNKFARMMTLMSDGNDAPEMAITYFRKLPEGFNLKEWTETLISGYALCFGYDPREFWPVGSGTLGTARETDIQHRKATSKGDLDFSLAFQEQFQKVLPESLSFEFQNRDVEGEKADAALLAEKADYITKLNQLNIAGMPVLTRAQLLEMMSELDLIPDEYTISEEPAKATDTGEELKKEIADEATDEREPLPKADVQAIVDKPAIQRAMQLFPDEPIVRYSSKTNRMKVLFYPDRLPRSFPVVERAGLATISRKFLADLRRIVNSGFSGGSILSNVRTLVRDAVADAYVAGLAQGGVSFDEMDSDDSMTIIELVTEQTDHVTDFVRAVREAGEDRAMQRDILDNRIGMWQASVEAAGQAGLASAKKNEMVTFRLKPNEPDSEESCATCQRLLGQRMRRKTVLKKGLLVKPGNPNYECGNWKCPHEWGIP